MTDDTDKTDVFVHQSELQIKDGFRSLAEGQKIEYVIGKDEKQRLIAKDVTGHDKADLQTQKSYNMNSYNIRGGSGSRGRGSRGHSDSTDH